VFFDESKLASFQSRDGTACISKLICLSSSPNILSISGFHFENFDFVPFLAHSNDFRQGLAAVFVYFFQCYVIFFRFAAFHFTLTLYAAQFLENQWCAAGYTDWLAQTSC
jgi:hypothetical protein